MHVAMTVLQFPDASAMHAEHHADSERIVHAAAVVPQCTHAPQHQHSNIRHIKTAQALYTHMDQELEFLGLQSFCSHDAISYLRAHKHGEGDNGG